MKKSCDGCRADDIHGFSLGHKRKTHFVDFAIGGTIKKYHELKIAKNYAEDKTNG